MLGSQITAYDLGAPFFDWPQAEYLGEDRQRGRTCHLINLQNPDPQATVGRVQLWLDKEFRGLLRADAYNRNGDKIRQLQVTSFRRVDQVWIPRGMTVSFYPPGQSLPATEKSRLIVRDNNDDAQLDPALFDPARFDQAAE